MLSWSKNLFIFLSLLCLFTSQARASVSRADVCEWCAVRGVDSPLSNAARGSIFQAQDIVGAPRFNPQKTIEQIQAELLPTASMGGALTMPSSIGTSSVVSPLLRGPNDSNYDPIERSKFDFSKYEHLFQVPTTCGHGGACPMNPSNFFPGPKLKPAFTPMPFSNPFVSPPAFFRSMPRLF